MNDTNRLTELKVVATRWGRKWSLYRCSCGVEKEIIQRSVLNGDTKSCGCLKAELARERYTTHGMSHSIEYACWENMKQRCYNKNHPKYPRYGGRGITVCESWLNSFEAFFADMGRCPTNKMSVDRKENDKGYTKDNCRWADAYEQANNH